LKELRAGQVLAETFENGFAKEITSIKENCSSTSWKTMGKDILFTFLLGVFEDRQDFRGISS